MILLQPAGAYRVRAVSIKKYRGRDLLLQLIYNDNKPGLRA